MILGACFFVYLIDVLGAMFSRDTERVHWKQMG